MIDSTMKKTWTTPSIADFGVEAITEADSQLGNDGNGESTQDPATS